MRGVIVSARRPVDNASFTVVRIGIGLLTAWEGYRQIDNGWVSLNYDPDKFHFTWWPFDFRPWPGPGMKIHMVVTIVAGLWLAWGWHRRWAAALAWVCVTYVFLLDKALYLNHIYLLSLLLFLLIWLPDDRAAGVWMLRFQLGVVYLFAGLGKVNADWMHGHPLDLWIGGTARHIPGLGWLFSQPHAPTLLSWAAMFFDLSVVFLMLSPRLRKFGYLAAVSFHLTNSRVFTIGIFPWAMIVLTTIFLPPSWPRQLWHDRARRPYVIAGAVAGALIGLTWYTALHPVYIAGAAFGGAVAAWLLAGGCQNDEPAPLPEGVARAGARVAALAWIVVQVAMPLRHFVYSGDVHWTEDGHRFAWHMLLRAKSTSSFAMFVVEPDGTRTEVDLRKDLSDDQIEVMGQIPDMGVQYAHHLEREAGHDIAVYAVGTVSLNGRIPVPYYREDVDLTKVPRPHWGTAWWIHPQAGPRPRA